LEAPEVAEVVVGPSRIQGHGVFAACDFSAEETVLWIDDSRVVNDTSPLRPDLRELEEHCDYLARGLVVLMRAPERYINSSCDPNTCVRTIEGVRAVVTLRPIKKGEEITYDYVINCHDGARWNCNCRSDVCRGEIPGSFFDLPMADQRRLVPLLDSWFVREHQERVDGLVALQADGRDCRVVQDRKPMAEGKHRWWKVR
jgi:hypothetical protein